MSSRAGGGGTQKAFIDEAAERQLIQKKYMYNEKELVGAGGKGRIGHSSAITDQI